MSMAKMTSLGVALAVVCGAAWTSTAKAIPTFKKQFEAKYVKKEGGSAEEQALAGAVKKIKCNVCHVGKKKKDRNAYGQALSELLDKKEDKKNLEKIDAALDTVAEQNSDPNDENSPTFGELIAQGKLPAGEEEAK